MKEELEKLLEDYHDPPSDYDTGCQFRYKDSNWEYCDCGLNDTITSIINLVDKEVMKLVGKDDIMEAWNNLKQSKVTREDTK